MTTSSVAVVAHRSLFLSVGLLLVSLSCLGGVNAFTSSLLPRSSLSAEGTNTATRSTVVWGVGGVGHPNDENSGYDSEYTNDYDEEEEEEEEDSFETLGLSREILQAVSSQRGWTTPTPIQRLAIPRLLRGNMRSMWGEAPTGSGKTGAYALPLLQLILQSRRQELSSSTPPPPIAKISSLILCPTRELAVQIGTVMSNLANNIGGGGRQQQRCKVQVIHGGVPLEPQIVKLANAARDLQTVDVLVATPGRLVDVLTYYDDPDSTRAKQSALERRLLDALDAKGKGRGDASLSLAQIEALKLDRIEDDGRSAMRDMLKGLDYLVLDEADRLLGRAFETEMTSFLDLLLNKRDNDDDDDKSPQLKLQTWLFSATFPKQIEPRVDSVLKRLGGGQVVRISCGQPDRLSDDDVSGSLQKRLQRTSSPVTPTLQQIGPASTIQLRTIRLERRDRTQALRTLLQSTNNTATIESGWDRVLVFVSTRYASEHVAMKLRRVGIESAELHGKLDQDARLRRLADFKKGKIRVLVATDVASRGLDVVGLPVVVNYDLPRSTSDFVHRIGRTGRAGRQGMAISFVTPTNEAQYDLIESRHLAAPVEREVLPGFEPNEEEWMVQSEASRISAPGTVHSSRGLAHDRMNGGIKGHRRSKKDRLREQEARKQAAVQQPPS